MTPPDGPRAEAIGPVADEEPAGVPVLAAAVLAAASGGTDDSTLNDILRAAVRHVDATYGALGLLTPDGRQVDRFLVVGMDDTDAERIGRLPTGKGVLGLLIADPTPLRLDDLADHPASIGFPPGHPPMRSFLGVPIRVGEAVFGNLYLTEKRGGGPFTDADTEVARALAAVAGLAITNARLAERSETRHRWGQAATEMATALLSGADPDDVLRAVSTQVSALTNADMAGVLLPSVDDDDSLTIVSAVGALAADYEGVRLPLTGTYLGALYEAGVPRVMQNISTMPVIGRRAAAVVELTATFGPGMIAPMGNPPGRGFLAVLTIVRPRALLARRPRPPRDVRHPRVGRPGTGPDAGAGAPTAGAGRPGPHRPRPARPRGPAHLRHGAVPGPPQPGPAAGAARGRRAALAASSTSWTGRWPRSARPSSSCTRRTARSPRPCAASSPT